MSDDSASNMSFDSASDTSEVSESPRKIVCYIHELINIMLEARFEADIDLYGHTFQSLPNFLSAYKTMAREGSKINLSLIRSMFIKTRTPLLQQRREEHKIRLTKELYKKAEARMQDIMEPEAMKDEDLWNEEAGNCKRDVVDGQVYLVRWERRDNFDISDDMDYESEDSEEDGMYENGEIVDGYYTTRNFSFK